MTHSPRRRLLGDGLNLKRLSKFWSSGITKRLQRGVDSRASVSNGSGRMSNQHQQDHPTPESVESPQASTRQESAAAAASDASVPSRDAASQQSAAGDVAVEPSDIDPVQAVEAELNHWRNVALRSAADFDNFRKRVAREREEAVRFGNQDLLEQLLPILDNFEMGMLAAAQDQQSMIYIGMDMVRKQLADFLAQNGVTEVQALGQAFDPNLHEAVSEEESSEAEEGTVLRVLRRGFRLRERLMRPATVVVAKAKGSEA